MKHILSIFANKHHAGITNRSIRLIRAILFLVVLATLMTFGFKWLSKPAIAGWFDDSWGYRQRVDITNAGTAQTDYQVSITLDTSALITAGKMQSDCDDLRITNISGQSLPIWIETGTNACNTTTTAIWTKIPSISTTGTTVFLYYGNPSAASTQNGNNVFNFFDDFSGSSIDSAKWTSTTGSPSISSGKLVLDATEGLFAGSYAIPADTIWVSLADPQATTRTGGAIRASTTTGTGWVNDGASNIVDILWWSNDLLYSETNSGETGFGAYTTGFKKYKITYRVSDADSVSYDYDNGALTSTRTGSNAAGTLYPVMYSSNGQSQYDWFFIRKTAATEPAVASPTNEEKSPAPVAYWKFDEGQGVTANNSTSVTGINGTITGATWQTEDQCISGKCLKFNGTSDYVSVADNPNLEGMSQITQEAWVNMKSFASGPVVMGKVDSYDLYFNASGTLYTDYKSANGGTIPLNTWTHIAMTYDGSNTRLYINGVQTAINPNSGVIGSGTAPFEIGRWASSVEYVNGFIDDVKIYNYARTAAQIKTDFNSKGSASSKGNAVQMGGNSKNNDAFSNGLVGYWKMDEAAVNTCTGGVNDSCDSSGNGHDLAWNGNVAAIAGKFGNGIDSDGSGDYTTTTASTDWNFGTGDYAISTWIKWDVVGSNYLVGYDTVGWVLYYSSGALRWWRPGFETVYTWTPTAGQWYHIVATRVGSGTNNTNVYVNGALVAQSTDIVSIGSSSQILAVDGYSNGDYSTDGKFDEVRIYKGKGLSPKEVRDLYNWAPGPIYYANFDEGTGSTLRDTSGNGYDSTGFSGTPNWDQGKFGKALYFDGSTNSVTLPASILAKKPKQITFEIWLKGKDQPTNTSIFAAFPSQKVNVHAPWGDTNMYWDYGEACCNGRIYKVMPSNYMNNNWTHFAFTADMDANFMQIYANGVLWQSGTVTANTMVNAPTSFYLGSYDGTNYKYKGWLDEFKIYDYVRTSKQIVEDMNAGHPVGGSPVGSQLTYYKFDEGYGTNVNDFGSFNTDGTITGASWSNAGKFGKALSFTDAQAHYVNFGTVTFPSMSQLTVSGWYKWAGSSNTAIQALEYWPANNGIALSPNRTSVDNSMTFLTKIGGVDQVFSSAKVPLDTNSWAYISFAATVSADGTSITVKGYKNGVLYAQQTISGLTSASFGGSSAEYQLGSTGTTRAYSGLMDEFKIYSSALTEDEIKLDYNHGSALVLGSTSTASDGTTADNSSAREYCIPGDTTSCSAPVAEWKFDEGSGVSANDTSGNANTGTWNGTGTHWTTGKIGKAGDFNGSSDQIISINNISVSGGSSRTVETWFKQSSQLNKAIVSYGVATDSNLFSLMTYNGTIIGHFFGAGYDTIAAGSPTYTTDAWHHAAITYDGTTVKIYVDGRFGNQKNLALNTTDSTLKIGNDACGDCGYTYFNGSIDNVRIFNYARTAAQIAWDYNKGAPVAHWKMDECTGSTVYDFAPNSNNGFNGNNGTVTIGASGTQTSVGTCTTSGTAWYNGATGKFNNSLNFDGTDDYVDIAGSGPLTTDRTVAFWAKPQTGALENWEIIVQIGVTGTAQMYDISRDNGTILVDRWGGGYGASTGTITWNEWNHIAYVYSESGSQGTIQYYINGKPAGSSTSSSLFHDTDINNAYIGDDLLSATGDAYKGQIDDVKIFNYALTPYQVKLLLNEGSAVHY